jgi:beta-N-acetylhexosaminidase
VAELRNWTAAARRAAAAALPADDVGLAAARRAVRVAGELVPMSDPLLVEIVPPANVAVGTVPWGLSRWVPSASVRRISIAAAAREADSAPEGAAPAHETRAGETRAGGAAADGVGAGAGPPGWTLGDTALGDTAQGDTALADRVPAGRMLIDRMLADAAGRSLLIVVRDAHRYPAAAKEVIARLLAARPDATLVEMGLPVWHPKAGVYLSTFGAASVSGLAAAEILGLAGDMSLTRQPTP